VNDMRLGHWLLIGVIVLLLYWLWRQQSTSG
jgi:hypothetical protein